jgi:hypothetical protein
MVIVTYRSEEVDRDHPLRRVLGDPATAGAVRRLAVPALSEAAVAVLAGPSGRDGAQLHAVTGGNPVFVTEALAAPGQHVPSTVRDAVLVRASRLPAAARAVLDVVSLVPDRVEIALLGSAFAVGAGALDEGIRAGMLVHDGPTVRFRHELARRPCRHQQPVPVVQRGESGELGRPRPVHRWGGPARSIRTAPPLKTAAEKGSSGPESPRAGSGGRLARRRSAAGCGRSAPPCPVPRRAERCAPRCLRSIRSPAAPSCLRITTSVPADAWYRDRVQALLFL